MMIQTVQPVQSACESDAMVLGESVGGVGEGGLQMARGLIESKSVVVVRRQAEAVLAELIRERAEAEDRQNASKRTDPYKLVSGWSSLDRAIDETRVMLRRLDEAEGVCGSVAGRCCSDVGSR